MLYLGIVLVSIIVFLILAKLVKYAVVLNIILLAVAGLGILIMPLDIILGAQITTWSLLIMILFWILFGISGFVSVIVVSPLLAILSAIRLLKK